MFFETWKLSNDSKSLEGISFTVREGDTTMMEKVHLTYENYAFHYIPDVPGDQFPVDFYHYTL